MGLVIATSQERPKRCSETRGLLVLETGVGPYNTFWKTQLFCSRCKPDILLCLGFCGGAKIDGLARVGQIIIANEVTYQYSETPARIATHLPDGLLPAVEQLDCRVGRFRTHNHVVTCMEQVKDEIAVDQESFFVVLAAARNIPVVVAKVVSDIIPDENVFVKEQLAEIQANLAITQKNINAFFDAFTEVAMAA